MIDALSRGQVEHKARRQIVQGLLRTGPLTVRGLISDTGLSMAGVDYHLKVLSRVGAVRSLGERRFKGDEIVYSLSFEGLPAWVCEGLLGNFETRVCLAVMGAIAEADGLDMAGVAEQTGLSEHDAVRYLLFLDALGLIVYASAARCERGGARSALWGHPDAVRWRVYFRVLDGDDDFGTRAHGF